MAWTSDDIPDQRGRIAVVTGGNRGLGLETVRELCRRGAHVIIGCRNLDKAAAAKADIERDIPTASLEIVALDLASQASIQRFVDVVRSGHRSVDLLFNNAGILATPENTTADGLELQYGTNHLGHFFLTCLVLPLMLEREGGRVVTTTSTARRLVRTKRSAATYDAWQAYAVSKRANFLFAVDLNRRLELAGSTVRSNAADPGFARTGMQASAPSAHRWLTRRLSRAVVGLIGHSAARGALPQLRAGTDGEDGGLLYRPRFISSGPPVGKAARLSKADERELADLWRDSERDLAITFDVEAMVAASR